MSNYIYSASTNAFYAVSLKKDYEVSNTWPINAVDINDTIAAEFMAIPPDGKIRVAGDDGYPKWANKPEPTHDELVSAANNVKQQRINQANDYMNSKQWPGKAAMGRLSDTEKAQYNEWLDYLDALDAVDTFRSPNINWPAPLER